MLSQAFLRDVDELDQMFGSIGGSPDDVLVNEILCCGSTWFYALCVDFVACCGCEFDTYWVNGLGLRAGYTLLLSAQVVTSADGERRCCNSKN